MVGAVAAGDGLARVAEIPSSHAGAPVAVIVPRLGSPVEAWASYERYVASRLAGGRPKRLPEVTAEVAISSGGRELLLLLGRVRAEVEEYLHMAAIAALTEVAVVEGQGRDRAVPARLIPRGGAERPDLDPTDLERRAARLGCDLRAGYTALCADSNGRATGRLVAALVAEAPGVLAQPTRGKVYAAPPGDPEVARRTGQARAPR